MNLSSYLHKRPGSMNWQLRWMVPLAARAALGKAEFTKSLGVSDRKLAETLAYPVLAAWQRQVSEALEPSTMLAEQPTGEAIPSDVEDYLASYYDVMRNIHGSFARDAVKSGKRSLPLERKRLEKAKEQLQIILFAGEAETHLAFTESEMSKRGMTLPRSTAARADISRKSVQTVLDSIDAVLAEMDGQLSKYKPSAFIEEAYSRRGDIRPEESLNAMFERYAKIRLASGRRLDGINQDRIIVARFAEFVGRNRAISSISRKDVREWRDILATVPRGFMNMKAYKGLGIKEVASLNAINGHTGLSPTTQNKYLSTISPLFRWAVQDGFIENNPCDGLFINIDKNSNPYPTFSAEEIDRIVNSPLFVGFASDGDEHRSGSTLCNDWRRWIPLLCLFTGSRIGEIAQLRINDIRHEHGRYFINISHDLTKNQKTKSNKSRIVPIHPILENAGFGSFYLSNASLPDGPLFPQIGENSRGHAGATPSRFWRRYLEKIGIKDGGDGRGSHSFRHTLSDELRAAGFMDDQFGPLILGHNKASVTAGYGRLPQGTADMLCKMIDGVAFKGVDFSGLLRSHQAER